MAIEFHCPNGHILEVDDAHAGAQIRCPACDVRCLVPPSGAAGPVEPPTPPVVEESLPQISARGTRKRGGRRQNTPGRRMPSDIELPGGDAEPAIQEPTTVGVDVNQVRAADENRVLHTKCGKCDQPLEFTGAMIGQDLACPACGQPFVAEFGRTDEHRREREIRDDKEEQELSVRWLYGSVFAGVIIVAALVAMILWTTNR
jgi:DNA-directed RNA polymerase subunit RPC12/RpoP